MRTHLTDIAVRSLTPIAGQQLKVWDAMMPGFGVRVNARAKSWIVMFGTTRRLKVIGRYPDVSLADARKKALVALAAPSEQAPRMAFDDGLDKFLLIHGQKLRPSSKGQLERTIRRNFKFGRKPLANITQQDITSVIDQLLDRPSEACHALKDARTFFKWCVGRRYIASSPCDGIAMPAKYIPRQRVLNADELKKVWFAANTMGYPFGFIVKLLILTGQRKSEIATLRFDFINGQDQTITLPYTKNGRVHTFPIGMMAQELIKDVPRNGDWLFMGRVKGQPYNGWNKHKAELDRLSGVADWTLHDLRRTFATNLAAINVPIHVTEKLLNHVSGTISGVAAIYNRHAYADEMRDAISQWEMRLQSLLAN